MDMNNTLLALQMLNGVKLYKVRIAGTSGNIYSYKSREEYLPGQHVLIQTKQTFVAGVIHSEIEDFDYTEAHDWKWILGGIFDAEKLTAELTQLDVQAKKKIGQAQALHEAKKILEATGLTIDDLAKLTGKKPEVLTAE